MRITTNMVSNQIIENLNINLANLAKIQEQTATGKRILNPSDDPLGTQRVISIKEAIDGINQYQRNADYVTNWVTASESALGAVNDSIMRANSLAVRGAQDITLNQSELDAIADEIDGLIDQVLNAANTRLEGKSIFSGYQIDTDAFTATRVGTEVVSVAYSGDIGVDQVEIDTGLIVNKNVPGDQILQPAAGVDVFDILIALRNDLRAGNTAGVENAIAMTDQAQEQVLNQISFLGNKTNQLEMADSNISEKKMGLEALNSKLEYVDMPEAIVQLQTAQNVYDAALQSSSRMLQQRSLMDFLG
ncbi:flagellar hook-associated protein FlgL [bacterium]|nr:flagellar hook-associated protein FlgL [bacterium]